MSVNEKKGLALHWQVIIGLLLGAGYAWLSIKFGWNQFTMDWIQPIGDIFINLLKLIAVPLVLFSIISGVASLGDINKLGRIGAKTLGVYLATTMFSARRSWCRTSGTCSSRRQPCHGGEWRAPAGRQI